MATQSTHVSSHSASQGCSILDRKKNLRTSARGPNGGSGRERSYLGHTPEYHSSSSRSSWSRIWSEFTIRQESSQEFCGTVVQWNWKTDPWSKRYHWCDHYWFQRTYMEIDKPIVQQSLSDHTCRNLHLLRLCAFVWGQWEMIRLQLGRRKSNGSRRIITSKIWIESMVCRRSSSGTYSQDSRLWASSRRFKIWWKTNSVNLTSSTTCDYNSKTIADSARKFPRGRWSFLGPGSEKKWYGELTQINPTDPVTKLQNKWCWISRNPVTRYFVPPQCLWEWN